MPIPEKFIGKRIKPAKGLEHLADEDGLMTIGGTKHVDFVTEMDRRRRSESSAVVAYDPIANPSTRIIAVGEIQNIPQHHSGCSSCDKKNVLPSLTPSISSDPKIFGPIFWKELHRWALDGNLKTTAAWLEAFAAAIPCEDCRIHWAELMAANPPDLSSRETFFAWTVDRHNDVNRRLDLMPMSIGEAYQRWG